MSADAPEPQAQSVVIDEEPLEITAAMLEVPASVRYRFERGMSYLAWTTLGLMLACIVVFAWQLGTGALVDEASIIAAGALHRDSVLGGEIWRLFSSMFLHGSIDHLLGNLVALYVLGVAAEHALGKGRFLIVYMLAGLAGGLLSMALDPRPTVGASGAIFGLMGFLVAFLSRHRHRLALGDSRIGVVVAVWAGYQVILGAFAPMIANFAHIGGVIGGMLLALLMPLRAGFRTGAAVDVSPGGRG